jgi:glyoxylase-like metal-dependent hydrolase (beta-lactamase superfamily II)
MPGSRITVGNAEIIALVDAPMQFPWNVFFPSIPKSEFEAYAGLYPKSHGEMFQTQAGAYAIRSEGRTILVDTGVGPGPIDWLGGISGRLLEDMRANGLSPDEVDVVVFTHLHGDHVGWNLDKSGAPTFQKARYMAPQADFDYFKAGNQPQMALVTPLLDAGRLDLFSGEKSITAEVTTYPTPGHTPGHTSVLVSSGGSRALICGDLAHHPAQVDRVEWSSAFDVDAEQAVATRRRVFDQLEADGVIAGFCHFPGPGFGNLVRAEGKRIFRGVA